MVLARTQTHTHTHSHTHHTHTHTHTHTYTHPHTYTPHTHTQTHTHTLTYTNKHTPTHTLTHTNTNTDSVILLLHPQKMNACGCKNSNTRGPTSLIIMRVSQMKTLNMFYLVIYWTQKVHNDFVFLCCIVLPSVGHSSNHEYHCWKLQGNRAVVWRFIALLIFSFDSPSYIIHFVSQMIMLYRKGLHLTSVRIKRFFCDH